MIAAQVLEYGLGNNDVNPGQHLLRNWGAERYVIQKITSGHINCTFLLTGPHDSMILQRVHPVFGEEVHQDIYHLSRILRQAGIRCPEIIKTMEGTLFVRDDEGAIWRALTHLSGETLTQLESPTTAREAGALLGRFHAALWDTDYELKHCRPGVHDTPRHVNKLVNVLASSQSHPFYPRVDALATRVQAHLANLDSIQGLPSRFVHGDPKITNFLFDKKGRASAMIDLDTMGKMPLVAELGDAFRSWCNLAHEDSVGANFSMVHFREGMYGYCSQMSEHMTSSELNLIYDGILTITLELTVRFLTDTLEESYFAWDSVQYRRSSEHQWYRAQGQHALALSIMSHERSLKEIVGHFQS